MVISSSNGIVRKNAHEETSSFILPEIDHAPETEIKATTAAAKDYAVNPDGAGASQLEDAEEQAQEILRRAQAEAEALKEQLKAEWEQRMKAAEEDGFKKGYEDGIRAGRQDAEKETDELVKERLAGFEQDARNAIAQISLAKEESLKRYQDELLDCALAVAEKVICVSLHTSGEVMKRMILSAAKNLKKSEWAKVYIDRFDYTMMMEGDADALNWLSELSDSIKFVVMDREGEGTCIIETPSEIVDISVNTQMENIREIVSGTKI